MFDRQIIDEPYQDQEDLTQPNKPNSNSKVVHVHSLASGHSSLQGAAPGLRSYCLSTCTSPRRQQRFAQHFADYGRRVSSFAHLADGQVLCDLLLKLFYWSHERPLWTTEYLLDQFDRVHRTTDSTEAAGVALSRIQGFENMRLFLTWTREIVSLPVASLFSLKDFPGASLEVAELGKVEYCLRKIREAALRCGGGDDCSRAISTGIFGSDGLFRKGKGDRMDHLRQITQFVPTSATRATLASATPGDTTSAGAGLLAASSNDQHRAGGASAVPASVNNMRSSSSANIVAAAAPAATSAISTLTPTTTKFTKPPLALRGSAALLRGDAKSWFKSDERRSLFVSVSSGVLRLFESEAKYEVWCESTRRIENFVGVGIGETSGKDSEKKFEAEFKKKHGEALKKALGKGKALFQQCSKICRTLGSFAKTVRVLQRNIKEGISSGLPRYSTSSSARDAEYEIETKTTSTTTTDIPDILRRHKRYFEEIFSVLPPDVTYSGSALPLLPRVELTPYAYSMPTVTVPIFDHRNAHEDRVFLEDPGEVQLVDEFGDDIDAHQLLSDPEGASGGSDVDHAARETEDEAPRPPRAQVEKMLKARRGRAVDH
eukprot:g2162.t1